MAKCVLVGYTGRWPPRIAVASPKKAPWTRSKRVLHHVLLSRCFFFTHRRRACGEVCFGRPSGGSARCYRKATEPRPRHSTRSANIQLGLSVFLVPRSLVAVVHCYGHNIPYAYLRIFPMHRFAFLMHAYASYASTECLPHRCDGTRAPLSELFSLLPAACLPRPAAAPPPRSSPRPPPRGRLRRRRRWCGVLPEEGVLGRAVGRPVEVLRVPECPNDAGAT